VRRCVSLAQPHIDIHGNAKKYRRIDRKPLVLRIDHVRISGNLLEIDTGFGTHFTLVFRRGIKNDPQTRPTLEAVWRSWADHTVANPRALPVNAPDAAPAGAPVLAPVPVVAAAALASAVAGGNESSTDCCVCMAAPFDTLIDCPHYDMCNACAHQVNECPMYRALIIQRIQKRIVMG
jgi:hypothetical protein